MIDTDKYEGHSKGPWKIYYDKWNKTGWWIDSIARNDVGEGDDICRLYGTAQNKDPTAKLVADAPLLLAEVKELQDALREAVEVVKEMEGMAYAGVDADKFANHALEFIGNVKGMIE